MRGLLKLAAGAGVGYGFGFFDFCNPHWSFYQMGTVKDGSILDTYWLQTSKEKNPVSRSLKCSGEVDVVIVGGGMAGLHTALSLSEKGKSVVVLEAKQIGWGASGLSMGMAAKGTMLDEDQLLEITNPELASKVMHLTDEAEHRLRHLIKKHNIKCDHQDLNSIELSSRPIPTDEEDIITHPKLEQLIGSQRYKWGTSNETLSINPLAFTWGLARACLSNSVQLFEYSPVSSIEKSKSRRDRWLVHTENGSEICSKDVVLCTGSHLSPQLHRKLALATVPIHTWVAQTEPIPKDKMPVKELPGSFIDDTTSIRYWRIMDDGVMLFGGLADPYLYSRDSAEKRLRSQLEWLYPSLKDVKFEKVWGGTLSFTRNAFPLIGKDSTGIYYATAFGGHGIVPSCMAGTMIADAISDGDAVNLSLVDDNFKPSYAGYPFSKFGGTVITSFYDALDSRESNGKWVPQVSRPW